MSSFRKLAGMCAQAWMARFRLRHGLGEVAQSSPAHASVWNTVTAQRLLLHVGCGPATLAQIGLNGFHDGTWREVRLDADETVAPDIVGSMTDMPLVPDGAVDAVFSSHGIEHLYWHDVPKALAEFRRVLRDDGFLVVTCPDLRGYPQFCV